MFDVLSIAKAREAQGQYVARMEIGDTPGFRNEYIHSLVQRFASSPYRYSPSGGELKLINKVIETQWPNHSEDRVVIGPANFLITASIASKTSPGDTILLPDPGFATYKLAADFLGLKIVYYPVYAENKPSFPDLNAFVKGMKKRPKVIIVNNPSNPLGIAFCVSEIVESISNFPELGIEIIFDETYINLVYDATQVLENDLPATRLRSFSKEHCAPGIRIGYALSDAAGATTMRDLMSLSISCVPQFLQFAVAEYLGTEEAKIFTENLKGVMARRLNELSQRVPEGSLQTKPNSAFYALLNTGDRGGDEAFKFLMDRNVSTCPGSKFGVNSKNSVRVSLAGSSETFEQDLEMLTSGLDEWVNSSKFIE
jgi:aspartate/methionine/tyrosine aminotransferase